MPVSLSPIARPEAGDELNRCFPDHALEHDVMLTGCDAWRLLDAVRRAADLQTARLRRLDLRPSDDGATRIRCRIGGIGETRAAALRDSLLAEDAVATVQVEHLVLSVRG
jgi:hypothetical protein